MNARTTRACNRHFRASPAAVAGVRLQDDADRLSAYDALTWWRGEARRAIRHYRQLQRDSTTYPRRLRTARACVRQAARQLGTPTDD